MKIDKGIPIPDEPNMAPSYRYPFRLMDFGDSFLVEDSKSFRGAVSRHKACDNARKFSSRNPGYDFEWRMTADGIRIWRI